MKSYIIRGAVAGLIGAVAAALTLLLLGENAISDAIALEEAASGGHGEEPMFTRGIQVGFGTLGMLLQGLLLGMIFGVVYVAVRRHLGSVPEWQRARRLAALGFLNLCLVPWLKYPPNPPAVGNPDTVNERTIAYLSLMAIGIIASVVALRTVDWCRRHDVADHLVAPIAVTLWVALVGLAYLVLPANPDAIEVPAKLIWRFRLASAGGQLALWSILGVVFGWLTVHAEGRKVFPSHRSQENTNVGG